MTDQQERCGYSFVPAYDRATVAECMRNADHGGPHEERRAVADYLDERTEELLACRLAIRAFEERSAPVQHSSPAALSPREKALIDARDEARAERDALDEKLEACRKALRESRERAWNNEDRAYSADALRIREHQEHASNRELVATLRKCVVERNTLFLDMVQGLAHHPETFRQRLESLTPMPP